MIDELCAAIEQAIGPGRAGRQVALAPYTTFRVGGPAECLVEVRSAGELLRALDAARRLGVGATVLGGGSNVLVSDRGIGGLVIRSRGGEIRRLGDRTVRADSGVGLNELIRWTAARGLAGLEAFAGTPGTVGGAVYGNAHWKGRAIGDRVARVELLSEDGALQVVAAAEMEFGYDSSRPQRTGERIVRAELLVDPGAEPAAIRAAAGESLAFRRRTQPLGQPSAGCIFRNPDPSVEALPGGVPASAGALIDLAGLKGARCGGASVSRLHANFIVNDGGATAADIRSLVDRCREAVRDRFGVNLREEIVYLGTFEV